MRSALSFLSLLAFGILAAGVLAVLGSTSGSLDALVGEGEAYRVDLGSLLIGLLLGLVLSALARVSWSQLPSRFVAWLLDHDRIFFRLGLAAVFLGVLFFY